MMNTEKLAEILVSYKEVFAEQHWSGEKFKWEAVKHFQEHWDSNAPDFLEMFTQATGKTNNLLASMNSYPRRMIMSFAETDPEATRAMFLHLYDESKDLIERHERFIADAEAIRQKYDEGRWVQHYQGTAAITTYLWLRYPDKYYIYRYSVTRAVANELESSFTPRKGENAKNLTGSIGLYNEVCEQLKKDSELKNILKSVLDGECYPDPDLKTLTIDFCFYISRQIAGGRSWNSQGWYPEPSRYSPGISVSQWKELLTNPNVFTKNSLEIMKRIKDFGGAATCTQLSNEYGESKNFYNAGSSSLAKRIAGHLGISGFIEMDGKEKWWPILYVGKDTSREDGTYKWKLRDELNAALEETDMVDVTLYANPTPRIWKFSHGPGVISKQEAKIFADKRIVVMNKDTAAKGLSKVSQGQNFTLEMKKNDYFYLCYGNSIQLFGRIISDEAVQNQEKMENWYERRYEIIAKSKDNSPYKGVRKWWTPNEVSTCIEIGKEDQSLFEKVILKPYFDLSLDDLRQGENEKVPNCWWLNASPKIWSFSSIKVGETQSYTLYNENGNKRRVFENFTNAKAGDLVIGYESNPVKQIVALARITQESDGKQLYFEKLEALAEPIDYSELKEYTELQGMEYFTNQQGSLFKLTKEEYDFLLDLIREKNPIATTGQIKTYTKEDFLQSVYMEAGRFDTLYSLLQHRKNVILQGAPGVGKTFAARRLAYAFMGKQDDSHIEFVQFHQNYSYEDFIMGYRPQGSDFELKQGVFYRFCQKAANDPDDEPYFFIIDEINRGNMSKIFGELLMLIEKDYRGTKIALSYGGMTFSVPENVFLIGMMNTADRSLAMIDYALRRRFSFFEMEPAFRTDGFKAYADAFKNETFSDLIEQICELNNEIASDESLGKGFCIGHSYFCNLKECTDERLMEIVEYEILPMLSEYWFDNRSSVQKWENTLRGVFYD